MRRMSDIGPPSQTAGEGASARRLRFPGAEILFPSPDVIRGRAPILVPALLAGTLSLATVAAGMPLVRLAYAGRPELLLPATEGLWAMALLSPVTILLKGLLFGGVAWAVMVLAGAHIRYRTLTSAMLYGQVILGLQGAWLTLILWLRGGAALQQPSDLILPAGLDALVSDPSSPLAALARGITPFYCAWFVFLTVVIGRAARRGWWRGALAALTVWTLVTGLGVVRALMM